ncbi:hypothetical protein TSAR_002093 [Trichomalopsis sarcophagae]|uniref:receptor protein-tyrosine kinase n=1 Tax=Trichomalopsis sarcophagae TaxID=543379 RepID=A0A232FL13_9HYME|nr:hypothetical protein TSAR_002093 [Trichomalopsis sarcophagae]
MRWLALATSLVLLLEPALALQEIGEVRNLSVSVVAVEDLEDGDEASFAGDTSLKLNVSWLPPEGVRKPSFYSVLVTSVESTNNASNASNSLSCSEGSIYYVGQNVSQSYVLLPENRFGSGLIAADDGALDDLDIEPACSYRVQVFAYPRNSLGNASASPPSVVYTVPECVGGRCSCERAQEELPVPLVAAASLGNGSTFLSWKVQSETGGRQVEAYRISVGVPHLTSSSGLTVYNKTHIFTSDKEESSYLWNHEEKPKKGTKIFVAAQDQNGCLGNEGSYVLKRPRHHPFYRKNAIAIVFAGLVAVCLMVSGIFSFIRYFARNHNYKLVSLRQKSSRQISSVLQNAHIEALLKNRNILYVEQEIQDIARKDLPDEAHEISYSRLRIVRELGQGQFGKVYLANLLDSENSSSSSLVAVKMSSLTSSDSARVQLDVRQQLLEEIAITEVAGSHPHLVGLVGCCTQPEQPVCLVLEYMRGGDLHSYLNRMRDALDAANDSSPLESPGVSSVAETTCTSLGSQSPSTPTSRVFFPNDIKADEATNFRSEGPISHAEMMRFALEIAKGMEHLEARGIVHRDLAARNVLMDENLVLKISDFGLSRKGAYTLGVNGTRRLPIRWMPPEAIRRRAFTSKSDVWSYGVVLWEIASLGDFPYARLSDEALLCHLLEENGRPELLEEASDEMSEIMDTCWALRPEQRPNFKQIVAWLESKRELARKNNPIYMDLLEIEGETAVAR